METLGTRVATRGHVAMKGNSPLQVTDTTQDKQCITLNTNMREYATTPL